MPHPSPTVAAWENTRSIILTDSGFNSVGLRTRWQQREQLSQRCIRNLGLCSKSFSLRSKGSDFGFQLSNSIRRFAELQGLIEGHTR